MEDVPFECYDPEWQEQYDPVELHEQKEESEEEE